MSFATRLVTSFLENGRNLWSSSNASQLTARSYHMLAGANISSRPIAVSLIRTGIPTTISPANGLQQLLAPVNTLLTQVAGFKVKGRLRRRCKDCYIVVRQQRSYVICPTHPRHKQMAMKQRDYKSWILTHATQSKQRPY